MMNNVYSENQIELWHNNYRFQPVSFNQERFLWSRGGLGGQGGVLRLSGQEGG